MYVQNIYKIIYRNINIFGSTVAYSYLVAIIALIIFFGRGGGNNIDKILAASKDFQTSLDKLVFIAQGFSFKALGEYLCLKVTWIRQMFGMVS